MFDSAWNGLRRWSATLSSTVFNDSFPNRLVQDLTSFLEQSLRVFGIFTALVVVLVESEWQRFMAQIRMLENWVARSVFQVRLKSVLCLILCLVFSGCFNSA